MLSIALLNVDIDFISYLKIYQRYLNWEWNLALSISCICFMYTKLMSSTSGLTLSYVSQLKSFCELSFTITLCLTYQLIKKMKLFLRTSFSDRVHVRIQTPINQRNQERVSMCVRAETFLQTFVQTEKFMLKSNQDEQRDNSTNDVISLSWWMIV